MPVYEEVLAADILKLIEKNIAGVRTAILILEGENEVVTIACSQPDEARAIGLLEIGKESLVAKIPRR